MSFKKNTLAISVLLLCVLLICFFTSNKQTAVTTDAKTQESPQIILDAGHAELPNTTD